MINVDELTLGQIKQLRAVLGGEGMAASKRLPMPAGTAVFIRTVTHHYTGRVVECAEEEVALTDAAWIADDGRFTTAMSGGSYGEIEPYPDGKRVVINRAVIIDWCEVSGELPRSQR
jgi:hypothetical protein